MDVFLDAFVVAIVGFVAAVALGMVVGRRQSREVRVLVLLVALLGVAGLVQVTRPAFVSAAPAPGRPAGDAPVSTEPAPPTTQTTSPAPKTAPPTPSPSPAPPRERTDEFIALVSADQYLPPDEMTDVGAPGPTSRGAYPCHVDEKGTAWTYPINGTYTSFHAVAVLTGRPHNVPPVTFVVLADGQPVKSLTLDKRDVRKAVDVSLAGVQRLQLQVSAPPTEKCDTLVANWAEMKVT